MEKYPLKPEQIRAPDNLSPTEIRRSIEELESKIRVLQGRANATTAYSKNTYHQHIAALEAKKAKIAALQKAGDETLDTWKEIRNGLDIIKKEVMAYFDKKPEDQQQK